MYHSEEEIAKLAKVMSEKILQMQKDCKEGVDKTVFCYQLDDVAAMARLITADLSDYEDVGC